MDWIDLALLGDETSLAAAISNLGDADLAGALDGAATALGLRAVDVDRAVLRMLVERVRPFALPASLWARPVTASDDPATHVTAHFARQGLDLTPDRERLALDLYARFVEERGATPVREADLQRCGYRCEHCGLAFCDEDLAHKALVSPFGARPAPKVDALKPHWNGIDALRRPTMDHHWPVSLYGDNASANLRVICSACNEGKADILALEQLRPWVGLPGRKQLLGVGPVSTPVFYAQIRVSQRCSTSGQGPTETELTVTLRDPTLPAVLDNLVTVASPG